MEEENSKEVTVLMQIPVPKKIHSKLKRLKLDMSENDLLLNGDKQPTLNNIMIRLAEKALPDFIKDVEESL